MRELFADLRHAARALLARPGYTLAALVTLALGLGATTAVFSAVHGYLLRQLPYPAGDRLVNIHGRVEQFGEMRVGISPADFLDVRERTRTLASMGMYDAGSARLGRGAGSARVPVLRATPSLFAVLGMPPALGRGFAEHEGLPGKDVVALLSHGAWTRRYAADPAVIGRRLVVDGRDVTVVGVMPAAFALPWASPELLLPLAIDPAARSGAVRGNWDGSGIARLRPGVTPAAAERELRGIWRQLVAEHPDMAFVEQIGYSVEVKSLRDNEVADLRQGLLVLQVGALLVLLVAAANLAGLTLSRLAGRARELAVRRALGAGTHRLLRLVMAENLILSLLGAAAATALALGALAVIEQRGLGPSTSLVSMRPDLVVLGVGLALALATGLLASLAPWWWLRRTTLESALRAESRGSTGGRGAQRFRSVLVVGQVAVSVALAVLVGLLGASLQRLLAVDTGFASEGVLVAQLAAVDDEGGERRQLDREALLAAVAGLPGTRAAGIANCIPFSGCGSVSTFSLLGGPAAEPEPTARTTWVSVGFLEALGIPVVVGRSFTRADLSPPGAVIVDRAFAARWFPGRSPLGQRLDLGPDAEGRARQPVIVGVVGNVLAQDLASDKPEPTIYTVSRKNADGAFLVARMAATAGAPAALRAVVSRADPTTTLDRVAWMRDRVRDSVSGRLAPTLLVGVFALLATVLSALGVYAVLALQVARRQVELGVRAALGADRGRLLRMVLGEGARLLAAGLALGAVLAFGASALVASLLFGVGRVEPGVYLVALSSLALIGLLACWLPAARAASIEPTMALREE